MKNSIKKSLISLGVFALVFGWTISSNVQAATPVEMYDNVWRLINSKYVDQTNNEQDWNKWRHKYDKYIQTDEDAYIAIDTMIASLNDPYTKFLNPKEFQEETSSIKGSLKGIGIQIGMKDGKLMVIAPIEDTPAEKAGLLADDEILAINGKSTKGITVDKAADQIRGEEGTQVTLLIKRKGVAEPKSYTITRAEIEIKSVTQKVPTDVKIPDDICYIRLSSFISRNAAKEVRDIIINNPDKKSFILDLRSNPGGLLSNAIYISDMFLNGGDIVSTVDRDNYKETQKASNAILTTKPLVILLNKGSASASEIFSGAMKDNKRAVLVGTQSFGKGLVQEINKLPNNAGINITIQKYLTPNGTDIHKKGITPDVKVELTDEEVKNKDDVQLKKAIEIAHELEAGTYVVSNK
ncbi:MAG TPA: peptidase S41 [Cyanobacteria bacterium UBA11991]|nr:S41 family peptidase [Cyanobacteriota bacterium]MDY6358146.1 S41 family peptidase [Cyanobacteriota bacterium]MDY6383405.1 S41 family peptidase [Cyanobacteriota bacterium]HCB11299.1 peptidase S41 [Cyanobacteria bacterium UBA11991]